jgi:hypothetical protein
MKRPPVSRRVIMSWTSDRGTLLLREDGPVRTLNMTKVSSAPGPPYQGTWTTSEMRSTTPSARLKTSTASTATRHCPSHRWKACSRTSVSPSHGHSLTNILPRLCTTRTTPFSLPTTFVAIIHPVSPNSACLYSMLLVSAVSSWSHVSLSLDVLWNVKRMSLQSIYYTLASRRCLEQTGPGLSELHTRCDQTQGTNSQPVRDPIDVRLSRSWSGVVDRASKREIHQPYTRSICFS